MATGRDRVWSVALELAQERASRGYLREIAPRTVVEVAESREIEVSSRTVRRVLEAMSEVGVLEALEGPERKYVLAGEGGEDTPTDMATGARNGASGRESVRACDIADGIGRDPGELLIYHLFADTGVESEPLSAYGEVLRVGLDPRRTGFGSVIAADARDPPLEPVADLAFLHPPCQRWSTLTTANPHVDPMDHPDLIEDARRVGSELAEEFVIENVVGAPLRDPVVLKGDHFGLPIRYRRAFETTFPVPEPPTRPSLRDRAGLFADRDGGLGEFSGEAIAWRSAKQVSGDYPAEELKRSGIPAPYIHYLMRYFLRTRL